MNTNSMNANNTNQRNEGPHREGAKTSSGFQWTQWTLGVLLCTLFSVPGLSSESMSGFISEDGVVSSAKELDQADFLQIPQSSHRDRFCEGVYEGRYNGENGILRFELRPIRRGEVYVVFTYRGETKTTYGYCSEYELQFKLVKEYMGRFSRDYYGVIHLQGEQYDGNRVNNRFHLTKIYR